MNVFDDEILNLWKSFHKYEVRYILVGGFAVNFHQYWRATNDIDLFVDDTLENRKKIRQVFNEIGLGDFEPIERVQFVAGWTDFRLNSVFRLDMMTSMKGLENIGFDDCFNAAIVQQVHDVPVRVLHINHLLTNKKAVNIPKDQIDVIELEKIRQILEETQKKQD
ncbi:MAG: hypothetical protein H7122_04885 [Chitinophagaceae bacterium]|nr:hypothetical protein [Chitinophagaceae bacterium]